MVSGMVGSMIPGFEVHPLMETDLDSGNLDEKHGSTQDMTSIVRGETDALNLDLLVIIHGLDAIIASGKIVLIVKEVIRGGVAHLDVVREKPLVDGLCGMGHEDSSGKVGLFHQVGERGGVIEVKVSDETHVHLGEIDCIKEG